MNYPKQKCYPEDWRPVVGFEGLYEVSSLGRVRSLSHRVRGMSRLGNVFTRVVPGKMLSLAIGSRGYPMVGLHDGSRVIASVHVLVLSAFIGPCPVDHEACHYNGHRDDNRLENLGWGTRKENRADAIRHGTQVCGTRQHAAKLTETVIPIIRARRAGGEKLETLARDYGVTACVISEACLGKTWRHVSDDLPASKRVARRIA